ncbi:MAG: L-2-hydroxyglutarate oxidase [Actinomycetes bacterium]
MSGRADFVVVGGGVVGLSIANELRSRFTDASVAVLEKESQVALHASGRNSGVLHAGFYYSPDSLKARLTRRGNELLKQFCAQHCVPVRNCGKVVVATTPEQLPDLDRLYERGVANGVVLEHVDQAQLAELEPLAQTCQRALWSPTTAVADPVAVTRAMADELRRRGGQVISGAQVVGRCDGGVATTGGRWQAGHVINAAGLYADRIAGLFGFCDDYAVLPFKGLYWYSSWPKGRLTRHVYPVPDPRNPFLGVHLTVTAQGGCKLGPTAIPAMRREDYGRYPGFSRGESAQIAMLYPAFLRSDHHDAAALVRSEVPKYNRRVLVKQARALVPSVNERDFRKRGRPGVRAQLVHRASGRLEMDFLIRGDAKSTHVLNAVSPAWTSALAAAEYVVDRIASPDGRS